ncbi:MAG: EspA/EspE family type VII secretion system effector [Actinomycetota bacterium]|uniref:ESX-1 secretion-associated protein EspA/EspE-like domain-containing protein n=1 Tax=Mycobacterium lentiflavum TaxID=141349 RepID=A0ABY3UL49_MYCLN|nr:EspA/EspE family type VII secretion system effector [Mycobacterium lentiflavum]MEE3064363.1 EspA/EspE family type VII secretion system effector [Actinomycetota bacterium]ULP40321.1 hypothetical protein MJO58_14930 [Mycobacterium lentiflavum]
MPADAAMAAAVLRVIINVTTAYKSSEDNDPAGSAAAGFATFQTVMTEVGRQWAKGELKAFLDKKPTVLLENGIALVSALEFVNGWSTPERASTLNTSRAFFDSAISKLELAAPDKNRWHGKAAMAYGVTNDRLKDAVRAAMEADKALQNWAKSQSEMVMGIRSQFSYTRTGLTACLFVAYAVYSYVLAQTLAASSVIFPISAALAQEAALSATRTFQKGAVGAALIALVAEASYHMAEIHSTTDAWESDVQAKYDAALKMVPIFSDTAPQTVAPTTRATTMPTFHSPRSGEVPVPSSVSSPAPDRLRGYPVAGGKGGYGGDVTKKPSHAQAPTAPSAPDAPAQPATPVMTPAAMSAAGNVVQQVGQGLQGAASQATNAFKQTATPGTKAPDNELTHGEKVDGAGAAVGAEGATRAPVDAAVDPQHPHEPLPPVESATRPKP